MVDFMEEFRGLIGIIAAGYDKEMKEQFLDANTGLYRRFPIKLRMKELKPMMITTRLYERVQTPELFGKSYIENFVRFSYHIRQQPMNQIKLVAFDRRTNDYQKVEEDQYASILQTYFTFFFSNNWTDLQILFDYIQYNHGLHYTPDEQIQNIITQFMKFKIKSDDVIEIFSRFHEGNDLIIHLKIKNLDLGSLVREELLDNEDTGTSQGKIDAMKQKVFLSIANSRNNSAKNATRIEEIESRLSLSSKKSNASSMDMPPSLGLSNMPTYYPPPTLKLGITNSVSHYAPPVPPSLTLGRSITVAPPPHLSLRRTDSESDYYVHPSLALGKSNSASAAPAAPAAPANGRQKKKLKKKVKSPLQPIKEEQ